MKSRLGGNIPLVQTSGEGAPGKSEGFLSYEKGLIVFKLVLCESHSYCCLLQLACGCRVHTGAPGEQNSLPNGHRGGRQEGSSGTGQQNTQEAPSA